MLWFVREEFLGLGPSTPMPLLPSEHGLYLTRIAPEGIILRTYYHAPTCSHDPMRALRHLQY